MAASGAPKSMRVSGRRRCRRSHDLPVSEADAREIVHHQIRVINTQWIEVCDLTRVTEVERSYFWRRQFLNPDALGGYRPPGLSPDHEASAAPRVDHGPVIGAQPPAGGVSALSTLNATEKAAVLDELTRCDGHARGRAEGIVRRHLADADASEVAEAVAASLHALEIGELASRSGRLPWGYVEPTEAGWDLLDETTKP